MKLTQTTIHILMYHLQSINIRSLGMCRKFLLKFLSSDSCLYLNLPMSVITMATSYDTTILSSQSHTSFRQQLCSSATKTVNQNTTASHSLKANNHVIDPYLWRGRCGCPLRQSFDMEMLKPRSVLYMYCKQNSVHLEMSLLATLCLK